MEFSGNSFCWCYSLLAGPALFAQENIPQGTIIPVRLNSTLSSQKTKPGQSISGRVMQDVPLPDGMKLRGGTRIMGHVRGTCGREARESGHHVPCIRSGADFQAVRADQNRSSSSRNFHRSGRGAVAAAKHGRGRFMERPHDISNRGGRRFIGAAARWWARWVLWASP